MEPLGQSFVQTALEAYLTEMLDRYQSSEDIQGHLTGGHLSEEGVIVPNYPDINTASFDTGIDNHVK